MINKDKACNAARKYESKRKRLRDKKQAKNLVLLRKLINKKIKKAIQLGDYNCVILYTTSTVSEKVDLLIEELRKLNFSVWRESFYADCSEIHVSWN